MTAIFMDKHGDTHSSDGPEFRCRKCGKVVGTGWDNVPAITFITREGLVCYCRECVQL